MIQINASPELCYVLHLLVLAMTFFIFSSFTLWASRSARKKQWSWLSFWIVFHFLGIFNIVNAMDKVRAWYDVLAQLKGW